MKESGPVSKKLESVEDAKKFLSKDTVGVIGNIYVFYDKFKILIFVVARIPGLFVFLFQLYHTDISTPQSPHTVLSSLHISHMLPYFK